MSTCAEQRGSGRRKSPCRRLARANANPSVHERRLRSARQLRRRARDAARQLDMRLLCRVTPNPPETVEAVRMLYRCSADWLLIEGAVSTWGGGG